MSMASDDCAGFDDNDRARLMLAELSHRVGNELAAAVSALRLARRNVCDTTACRYLDQAAARLEHFSEVHRILDSCHGDFPLDERLEVLCQSIAEAKAAARRIHIAVAADDVTTDAHTAWTVCVVAAELITNALKHAFPGNGPGLVAVELREEAAGLVLIVADNGLGPCRAEHPRQATSGIGLGLLTDLAAAVGGTVRRTERARGATVSLTIPIGRAVQ